MKHCSGCAKTVPALLAAWAAVAPPPDVRAEIIYNPNPEYTIPPLRTSVTDHRRFDIDGDGRGDIDTGHTAAINGAGAFFYNSIALLSENTRFYANAEDSGESPYLLSRGGPTPLAAGEAIGAHLDPDRWQGGRVEQEYVISEVFTAHPWISNEQEEWNTGFLQEPKSYIGLLVELGDGMQHYAWLGFRVRANDDQWQPLPQGRIEDWAWESVPGRGIVAGAIPEPSTALLMGLGGLALYAARARSRRASVRSLPPRRLV